MRELHDLLAEQARRLEMGDQGEPAARLWGRLRAWPSASCATSSARWPRTGASSRWPRPRMRSTRSARLHLERGEPAEAVPWLERALGGAEPERKAELVPAPGARAHRRRAAPIARAAAWSAR